jgi:hypothetical protein
MRALGGFDASLQLSSTLVQNPYSDPSLLESDADKSFSQSTLQQTAQKRFPSNDAVIAKREKEINEIATGIIELSDIFKELQSMIIDQGTMLDRIDYNVERMTEHVKGADKELTIVRCLFNYVADPTEVTTQEYSLLQLQSLTLLFYRQRATRASLESERFCCYSSFLSLVFLSFFSSNPRIHHKPNLHQHPKSLVERVLVGQSPSRLLRMTNSPC